MTIGQRLPAGESFNVEVAYIALENKMFILIVFKIIFNSLNKWISHRYLALALLLSVPSSGKQVGLQLLVIPAISLKLDTLNYLLASTL